MSEQEIKKQIAEILRANIHYSPQLENYVVHGAIEAIWKLMQEYAAQSAPKQEDYKMNQLIELAEKEHIKDLLMDFMMWHSGNETMTNEKELEEIVNIYLQIPQLQSAPKQQQQIKQEKYQVGSPDYDVVGKYFEEISLEHKDKDFMLQYKKCEYSNDFIHYLIYDNKLFTAVIERRTEFNDLEYSFINFYAAQSAPKQVEEIAALKSTIRTYGELNARLCNDVVAEKDKHIAYVEQAQKDYDALWNKLQDAQSAPKQSAGVWVKASERLPDVFTKVFIKVNGVPNIGLYNKITGFFNTPLHSHPIEEIEWLDEGQQLQSQSFNYGYNENKQDEIYNENQELKKQLQQLQSQQQELFKIIKQGDKICDCPECGAVIMNGMSGEVLKLFRDSKLFKPQQVEQQEDKISDFVNVKIAQYDTYGKKNRWTEVEAGHYEAFKEMKTFLLSL